MSRQRSAYSFDGDLMRIVGVAAVVGLIVAILVHLFGVGVGGAVMWGVLAAALSTVLVGPLSSRRPARSNSSS
jgi:hypothetical protein